MTKNLVNIDPASFLTTAAKNVGDGLSVCTIHSPRNIDKECLAVKLENVNSDLWLLSRELTKLDHVFASEFNAPVIMVTARGQFACFPEMLLN